MVNNIKESDETWSICAGYKPAGDSNYKKDSGANHIF